MAQKRRKPASGALKLGIDFHFYENEKFRKRKKADMQSAMVNALFTIVSLLRHILLAICLFYAYSTNMKYWPLVD